MLFLIFLLCFVNLSNSGLSNVGTTLYHNKKSPLLNNQRKSQSDCWTNDEIALLKARKIFENIIPPELSPDKVDVKYIKNILAYFRRALKTIEKEDNSINLSLLKRALADTIGGHLRRNILPTTRFAYYAGYIPYRHVRNLHDFYESITTILNTKGQGWKAPALIPEWANLTVVKVVIGGGLFEPCASLVMERDKHLCIHFPKPKTDDLEDPNALLLPFKERNLISLKSPTSENILVNYYTTAARCILEKATNSCRHSDFVNFNNEIWHWMKNDVAPRLTDEKLYAGFGGVLRVAAAVQTYGKGLTRRNLFDAKPYDKRWKIWKRFTNERSHLYNTIDNSTYTLDILIVLVATLFMYTILVISNSLCNRCKCYDYLSNYYNNYSYSAPYGLQYGQQSEPQYGQDYYGRCNDRIVEKHINPLCKSCLKSVSKCSCKVKTKWGRLNKKHSKHTIAYSTVESNFPAMLPAPASPASGSRRGSSVKTRVYDLNEDKEKEMEVVMKESPLSDSGSSSSSYSRGATLVEEEARRSPPRLETPISQVRLARGPPTRSSVCTSVARSWPPEDQSWSDSGTSSSARSSSPRWRSSNDTPWSRTGRAKP